MDIRDTVVGEHISDAIEIMRQKYGLKCRGLSEILSLRKFVVEALSTQGDALFSQVDPSFEAVARLLKENYSIDFVDLHKLDNGKIQIGMYSRLVSRDRFDLDQEFKEYIQIMQERMYLP